MNTNDQRRLNLHILTQPYTHAASASEYSAAALHPTAITARFRLQGTGDFCFCYEERAITLESFLILPVMSLR